MADREHLLELVRRLRDGRFEEEEASALVARFVAGVPHPDAEHLLFERDLGVEQIVDFALAGERLELDGMVIPAVREPGGARWLRFSDPRRTALHWALAFRHVVERATEHHDQGFSVGRTASDLDEARRRWTGWTGRELGADVYQLAPAWSRPGRDEAIVVPRAFLLALYQLVDRERLRLPGGGFGAVSHGP